MAEVRYPMSALRERASSLESQASITITITMTITNYEYDYEHDDEYALDWAHGTQPTIFR